MKRHVEIWNQEDNFPHDPGEKNNLSTHQISAKVLLQSKMDIFT